MKDKKKSFNQTVSNKH